MAYIGLAQCQYPKTPSENLVFPPDIDYEIDKLNSGTLDNASAAQIMRNVEERLAQLGRCINNNKELIDDIRIHNFGFDDQMVDRVLRSFNSVTADLHANIGCMLDSIMSPIKTNDPKIKDYVPSPRQEFKYAINKIKQIGDDSAFGYALRGSLSDKSNMFVIKSPRNPEVDELSHEAVVGLYAMNNLRRYLPNYMYVYSYTKCSPPLLSNKETLTWCAADKPGVSYLINENVRDARSLGEFIKDPKITKDDVWVVFLQLFNALNLAYEKYEFTHYDMHAGNVLVREYSRIMAIPFYKNGTIRGYMASKYIPYIIDYGNTRVKLGKFNCGRLALGSYVKNPLQAFPLHDVYKIIGFTTQYLLDGYNESKKDTLNFMQTLFNYFNEGSVVDRVKRREADMRDYFELNRLRDRTVGNYIDWLNDNGIVLLHTDLDYFDAEGIYIAPIKDKMDTCYYYDLLTQGDPPANNLEFCKAMSSIDSDNLISDADKMGAKKWLNDNYNSTIEYNRNVVDYNVALRDLDKALATDKLKVPSLSDADLTDPAFIDQFRRLLRYMAIYKEFLSDVTIRAKSDMCALTLQNKLGSTRNFMDKFVYKLKTYAEYYNARRKDVKTNFEIAQKALRVMQLDKNAQNFWRSEVYPLMDAL